MKILHVALLAPGEANTSIGEGFVNNLVEYSEFDWIKMRDQYGIPGMNAKLREHADQFKPELTFMQIQSAGIIDHATADHLRNFGFVVNWTGDVRKEIEWYAKMADHVDLTLFTNMTDVEKIRERGKIADYLQIGFDHRIFFPAQPVTTGYPDIVFMGTNYLHSSLLFPLSQERYEMVRFMYLNFPGKFQPFGGGWPGTVKCNPLQEADVYRGCKIAINQNHFDYKRFSSDRIFRAMGSGAFMASKYYDGIEEEFTIDDHLVVWRTFDELKEKCEYYLKRDSIRKQIALSGMRHVHATATWKSRVKRLLEIHDHYKNFTVTFTV